MRNAIKHMENRNPYCWLVLGLILTLLSYGRFNTGICAWFFAIPLLRYINIRTRCSSIILMLIGMIFVANITFWELVENNFNIMNQVYCTLNGIRMWFPFLVYFLCRYFKAKNIIAYCAFPAAFAAAEFFIDNPFVAVVTSLSVSQFWNIGFMQLASITGVVGVTFIVTFSASVVNYIWEEGNNNTLKYGIGYSIIVLLITSVGMLSVGLVNTWDRTVRVATSLDNTNYIDENESILNQYEGSYDEKYVSASIDMIRSSARDAAYNKSSILVFPETAFDCPASMAGNFVTEVQNIAKENSVNVLFPLLILPETKGDKEINSLYFINNKGELLNRYIKNHLVPVIEEPITEKGDGSVPVIEIDGVKYTYLICADFSSNKYAYKGREADIMLNPSYDWESFQYFTSYAAQARAIECGFSLLRNPVDGNIILYDCYGRPRYIQNSLNVHKGIVYIDIPKEGRQTFYGMTGNWFPWLCAAYMVFAVLSGMLLKKTNITEKELMNKEVSQ